MKHLQDLQVLVLGLGDSGLAMARWCARCGAQVSVWDSRDVPPQAQALRDQVPAARLFVGALVPEALDGVQLVLRSPGLAPTDPRIAEPLAPVIERGVLVQGELELFGRALADLNTDQGYAPKVIAITGTNGKTTTTAMTALLVARAGRRVAMAGNIGPTMLQSLAEALDLEATVPVEEADAVVPADAPPAAWVDEAALVAAGAETPSAADGRHEGLVDAEGSSDGALEASDDDALDHGLDASLEDTLDVGDVGDIADDIVLPLAPPPPAAPVFVHLPEVWVLELSSFQLDEAKGFEPDAAAVLNLTEDHLDWHGGMAAYVAAKARVYGKQAVMIVNRDDARVERMVPEPIPVKGRNAKPIERHVIRFGVGAPQRPGDYGIVTEHGMAWLVRALEADLTLTRGRKATAAEDELLHIQRLMPADALRVRGRHNAANALAALALAGAVGCPLAPMLHGLREYPGEPHRLTYVATLNGVDAFDDSKGTNVGATVAALRGLGADKSPARLVVILGGDGKGQDFAPLREPVSQHARAVATLGRDAALIEQALADTGVPLQRHDSLEAATRWCFERAHSGDAVLLSPACASLDMFRNYGHRADVFVAEVQALVAEQGGMA